MDDHEAARLRRALADVYPDADIQVMPDADGAQIVIDGGPPGLGNSNSGEATTVVLSVSSDGPMLRALLGDPPP